jgi:hypothetical protein
MDGDIWLYTLSKPEVFASSAALQREWPSSLLGCHAKAPCGASQTPGRPTRIYGQPLLRNVGELGLPSGNLT